MTKTKAEVERAARLRGWPLEGRTSCCGCSRRPGQEHTFGGLRSKLNGARLRPTGQALRVWQQGEQFRLSGLFAAPPRLVLGAGCRVTR